MYQEKAAMVAIVEWLWALVTQSYVGSTVPSFYGIAKKTLVHCSIASPTSKPGRLGPDVIAGVLPYIEEQSLGPRFAPCPEAFNDTALLRFVREVPSEVCAKLVGDVEIEGGGEKSGG